MGKTRKTAKKAPAKKAPAKKAPAKKAPAKKAPAKKAPAKKALAKKAPAREAPAREAPARKAPARTTARRPIADRRAAGLRALSAKPPEVAEASADDALVEETLSRLAEHEQRSAQSALEVGRFVLARYFDGDADRARSKRPSKPASYAALAERAELETSWDARALRDAVVAAIVFDGLPSAVAERVPASYLVRLDAVDDQDERLRLAQRIADGSLRGSLARSAIGAASESERLGGRARMPGPQRLAGTIERALERATDYDGLDPSAVKSMDALERAELAGRLDDAARRLTALAARIRKS
ncbi:MAG: histone H1-like repetitive region-containing protein [Sandaracinaceae bacterium]|nr:histone H1-like repetitive region-containing protein [Sandaracinaceae bacterium]